MLRNGKWWIGVLCLISLLSCKSESSVNQPNVDHIKVNYKVVRYEQLLEDLNPDTILDDYQILQSQHSVFTDLYFKRLVPIISNDANETEVESAILEFIKDDRISFLLDTVRQVFSDFEKKIIPALDGAFKNCKYYFPQWEEPNIYTLVSEYAYQHFLFEDEGGRDGLGIGLDMYFGRDFPYSRIAPGVAAFSSYITRSFDKEHMVKKTMDVILDDIIGPPPGSRMLDQMIHNGKKLYFMKHLLPDQPDSIIMEYTSEQMDWVAQNEEEMWAFFFKEELFYQTDMNIINKYINTSPNSPGMPQEAPGRTGNYMGWQIIKAYMERNPEVTFEQLIVEKNAQLIMDQSRYKPRRN